jgi:transcriptional regulator with XRE-family HTH domain
MLDRSRLREDVRRPQMKAKQPGPTLGGKILELIEARGLTIAAAAKVVGMHSRQQLWRICHGDIGNPGILTVQQIVRGLGGQMEDLFEDGDLVAGEELSPPVVSEVESDGPGVLFDPKSLQDERRRFMASSVLRSGQAIFREKLMRAYGGRCAITGCNIAPVLEAAHVIPYCGPQSDRISNGLLLRLDLHALFDAYLLAIDPREMKVRLSDGLRVGDYEILEGRKLRLPEDVSSRPSYEALSRHFREFASRDGCD